MHFLYKKRYLLIYITNNNPYLLLNILEKRKNQKIKLLKYICPIKNCNKIFKFKNNLIVHIRTHYKIKPYKCSYCQKSFNEKGNLKIHLRIHTGERPYQCKECQKNFKAFGQLKDHIISHTDYKPFQCPYCLKKYRRKGILKRHMDIHLNDPLYCANKKMYDNYLDNLKLTSFYSKYLIEKSMINTSTNKEKKEIKKLDESIIIQIENEDDNKSKNSSEQVNNAPELNKKETKIESDLNIGNQNINNNYINNDSIYKNMWVNNKNININNYFMSNINNYNYNNNNNVINNLNNNISNNISFNFDNINLMNINIKNLIKKKENENNKYFQDSKKDYRIEQINKNKPIFINNLCFNNYYNNINSINNINNIYNINNINNISHYLIYPSFGFNKFNFFK